VLVLESKELEVEPVATLTRVWDFLGVPRLDYGSENSTQIEQRLARVWVHRSVRAVRTFSFFLGTSLLTVFPRVCALWFPCSLTSAGGVKMPSKSTGSGWRLQSNSTIPDDQSPAPTTGQRARGLSRGRRARQVAPDSPAVAAVAAVAATIPHSDHELRQALYKAYLPFNQELYRLLGRRFPWDPQPPA
jgi:hypothetical protein